MSHDMNGANHGMWKSASASASDIWSYLKSWLDDASRWYAGKSEDEKELLRMGGGALIGTGIGGLLSGRVGALAGGLAGGYGGKMAGRVNWDAIKAAIDGKFKKDDDGNWKYVGGPR